MLTGQDGGEDLGRGTDEGLFVQWFGRLPSDPRFCPVFTREGTYLGLVLNLIICRWNSGKLLLEPGVHEGLPISDGELFIKSQGNLVGPVEFNVNVQIGATYYHGNWELIEAKGFKDELGDGFHVHQRITTSSLSTEEIEKTWQRIDDPKELAIGPPLHLVGQVSYPLLKDEGADSTD